MARHDDGDRVGRAGVADGTRRRIGLVRELAIGTRRAKRDVLHRLPDALLEGRTGKRQRQIEFAQLAGEIGGELAACLAQQFGFDAARRRVPAEPRDMAVFLDEAKRANRARQGDLWHGGLLAR